MKDSNFQDRKESNQGKNKKQNHKNFKQDNFRRINQEQQLMEDKIYDLNQSYHTSRFPKKQFYRPYNAAQHQDDFSHNNSSHLQRGSGNKKNKKKTREISDFNQNMMGQGGRNLGNKSAIVGTSGGNNGKEENFGDSGGYLGHKANFKGGRNEGSASGSGGLNNSTSIGNTSSKNVTPQRQNQMNIPINFNSQNFDINNLSQQQNMFKQT